MKQEDRYDSLFKYYGEQMSIDWKLLKAQGRAESALDPDAESRVGAEGLCQFMPKTWSVDIAPRIRTFYMKHMNLRKYSRSVSRRDPEDSILGQALYMRQLMNMFTTTDLALAAYNWGMGNIKKTIKKVQLLESKMPIDYNNIYEYLPKETKDYVARLNRILFYGGN